MKIYIDEKIHLNAFSENWSAKVFTEIITSIIQQGFTVILKLKNGEQQYSIIEGKLNWGN